MVSLVDGGNSFQKATNLGFLRFTSNGSSVGVGDTISLGETVDWYKVRTKGRSFSSDILQIGGSASLNQTIDIFFRPSGKNQGVGRRIARISGGSTDVVQAKALTGTYFLKVSLAPGATPANSDTFSINLGFFKIGGSKASSNGSVRSLSGNNLFT